ncbi:rhodanese-related sulfurtransferase [Sphingobium sp. JS3065]|uniref:oxygen-dependent tRNA uridine(34) hydroxylase TrhO n=1 Tax=Sphingobium sp. JS3065 TaxID=2970925 RepID=UPI0022642478|nr:rhodanese-related sulfurtransferase [Sphingobium sp. JS3065]UZW54590.1 rhodanese-related sulfurtransferase [Sphingobium sp. JS3065]
MGAAMESAFTIAALYRFASFPDPDAIARDLRTVCADLGTCGTLIVAGEGINGTVAGGEAAIKALVAHIRTLPGCADLDVKYAQSDDAPFARMKVKVKTEIVTLGAGDLDPANQAGAYLDPADWNALIADPDTVIIDTRNAYEVAVGSFEGAIDPGTRSFRDFPGWFDGFAEKLREEGRTPRIAMFCTGGIRCEKSTALVRARGFEEVYHLRGGILRYLEEMPEADSRWQGDCYVFDERVAVGHGLKAGDYVTCRGCGLPHLRDAAHDCAADGSGVWPHRAGR